MWEGAWGWSGLGNGRRKGGGTAYSAANRALEVALASYTFKKIKNDEPHSGLRVAGGKVWVGRW